MGLTAEPRRSTRAHQRRRNGTGTALGRNLVIEDDPIRLIFRNSETKNHTPISWFVPDFIKPYLLRYLQEHLGQPQV